MCPVGQQWLSANCCLSELALKTIAFCPIADVVDAFETLAEDIDDDYQGLLDYFEDTYIMSRI